MRRREICNNLRESPVAQKMKAQTPKRAPLRPPSPLNAGTPSLLRIDALQTSHQEEIAHLQNSYDERLRSLAERVRVTEEAASALDPAMAGQLADALLSALSGEQEAQIGRLCRELAARDADAKRLERELRASRARVAELEAALAGAREEGASLAATVEELRGRLGEAQSLASEQRERQRQQEPRVSELQAMVERLTAEKSELQASLGAQQRRVDDVGALRALVEGLALEALALHARDVQRVAVGDDRGERVHGLL